MTEQMLSTFERKILRKMYVPIQDKGRWLLRWNGEICTLYQDLNIVVSINIRRIGWAGRILRI
jgi:hypothetical protein